MKTSLPTRLEGAAAGSRELEYDIKEWLEGFDDYWSLRVAADWTTSIDAAVALAERVLPFWAIELSTWGPMNRVTLNECDEEWWHRLKHRRIETQAATPALALCAAIVRAHEQVQG